MFTYDVASEKSRGTSDQCSDPGSAAGYGCNACTRCRAERATAERCLLRMGHSSTTER